MAEKSPIEDTFTSSYITEAKAQYVTVNLSTNIINKLLDFNTNDMNVNVPQINTLIQTGGVENAQSSGELSNFRFGYVPTPSDMYS